AHAMRLELADQLFFPIAVNIFNPSQPMMGGSVGNRGGQPRRLAGDGAASNPTDGDGSGGNTAAYGADFNALDGDPVTVIKTTTSDGVIFTIQKYDGSGVITVDDPVLGKPTGGLKDFTTVARYIVKSDGVIYDLLEARNSDSFPTNPAANGPYRHWELAASASGAGYTSGTNSYNPPIAPANITQNHYTRAVGRISFRPKEGASSGAIQEQLTRAQSTLDTMSRLLRSLHDEAKGPFANIGPR
ncbi:MAG: hypothetical protein ACAI44_00075, partial [Candidatus Sericytochromatia bacterium]